MTLTISRLVRILLTLFLSVYVERRELRVWVIDFNQVQEFDFTETQIPLLVDAFFANEAYFPRTRPADSLYNTFSKAYLEECNKIGEVAGQLGQMFIMTLEAEQVRKDANRQEKMKPG